MKITLIASIVFLSQTCFATVLTSSTSVEKSESPYLEKKLLLNLMASSDVVGVRGGYFFTPKWGVLLGEDFTSRSNDTIAAIAYRWSSKNTAMETVTLKAGGYFAQASSSTQIKYPYGIILEADVAISLAPESDSTFLLLGVSSKSSHTDENSDVQMARGRSLFHAGLGVVF